MIRVVEWAALGLELSAVAIIVVAFAYGMVRYLLRGRIAAEGRSSYDDLKASLGRALLLGLEFLVAADVIRTVAVEPTLLNVALLGVLVVIRTFLSWSVVVETEGDWPWRLRRTRTSSTGLKT